MGKIYYQAEFLEVAGEFGTSIEKGLTHQEVKIRIESHGENKLVAKKGINPLRLFLRQFKDVLILVLIASALISFGIGFIPQSDHSSTNEAILILLIVLAIAAIGFFNEYKAERTVEALKKLVSEECTVLRGGVKLQVAARLIVQGDVVLLSEGEKIPADLRLVQSKSLLINESSLTGESAAVEKTTDALSGMLALGDQRNMAFSGTYVSQGTAIGIVVAIGQSTELGKIATLLNDVEDEQTPMQKKLDDVGKKLAVLILGICSFVFVAVLLFVEEAQQLDQLSRIVFAFTAAVALAVAAIPEGLAFVVRISLALGARRMAVKNALVRRLSAVEALGSTDIICSDKTGTLTKNEMTVRACVIDGQKYEVSGLGYDTSGSIMTNGAQASHDHGALKTLLTVGSICNDARLKDGNTILGDPTEASMLVSAAKLNLSYEELQSHYERIDEIPFTSERKLMTTVHRTENGLFIASKGAIEKVLSICNRYCDNNGTIHQLDATAKKQILSSNDLMSQQALRVLAFAYNDVPSSEEHPTKYIETNMIFAGLQGMMDPPRKEVVEVIKRVQKESGMRVLMITGDYIETAKAIAKEIGIEGEALSGVDIENLDEETLRLKVETTSVFARVNPEHKIRIVEALKANGHQVAMTGDGVNDAPAIKAANIGIAMGITGTDASKEAADLILLDDQFLTIIAAIEEGRGIYENLRKFLNLLLSTNFAKVLAMIAGVFMYQNLLLSAAQLLFINILSDGLPAVALGSDASPKDVLSKKPAHYKGGILNRQILTEIIVYGASMAILLLALYGYNLQQYDQIAATSAAFLGTIVFGLVRLATIRAYEGYGLLHNPFLIVASFCSLLLGLAVLYIEPIARNFGVEPITTLNMLLIVAGSMILVAIMHILRLIMRKRNLPNVTA